MMEVTVNSHQREELIDVTAQVQQAIIQANMEAGVAVCFVPHTTAAITINENADPDVARDLLYKLGKEFPQSDGYRHGEGNSDAHVKSSLVGCSLQILVEKRQAVLGRWQAIYFCEFDGPRSRRLYISLIPRA